MAGLRSVEHRNGGEAAAGADGAVGEEVGGGGLGIHGKDVYLVRRDAGGGELAAGRGGQGGEGGGGGAGGQQFVGGGAERGLHPGYLRCADFVAGGADRRADADQQVTR